ncbi:hypothetical protein A2415_03670 [candidate division WWE3 bacterium RIFOXYC1_FULL_39_7]|uniref:EamA domain-containing protein n=2 Tax=Katanobacteria TaxID=422282 RepID=A0A1F4X7L8_UNCKA|nr:MAG: hypothetical protein A2415_03670 [candidate division WWE3 bacterium RIFOXYC1_FULL_39_7]OGC77705.1 MAG: hypothetical protein A2619_03295 [candidate division WWE3 bacterium RIFOXYD1_FULL_39_9]
MRMKKLPPEFYIGFSGLILVYLIWAAAGPVIKLTLNYLPPFTFLFLRFLAVCIIILPLLLIELKKQKINKQDYFKIFILGVFSQTSLALIFLGLNYTTAIDFALISLLGPLLSMAAGHYLFNDKFNTGIKFGIILASLGTLFVTVEPILNGNGSNVDPLLRVYGNVLAILYTLAFLLYIIWSKISMGEVTPTIKKGLHFLHMKPMTKKYPPVLLMSLSFFVGMATLIPLALLENLNVFGKVEYSLMFLDKTAVFGLMYMVLLSSIAAYFLFEWSLTKVTVSDTAILGYLQAVFTLPFAYMLLGELPTKYALIGGAIIAVGVIIAESSYHLHKKRSKAHRI